MKLDADIAELKHQRVLLLNVSKWYIAPLMTAVFIIVSTDVVNHRHLMVTWRPWAFLVGYFAFCAFLAWRINLMNRRGVEKKIEPRIAELERLRTDILSAS